MEKELFVEIHSLDNERGCFASNRSLADFFGLSDRQIHICIWPLIEKGFFTVCVRIKNERIIRTAEKDRSVPDNELRTIEQPAHGISGLSNRFVDDRVLFGVQPCYQSESCRFLACLHARFYLSTCRLSGSIQANLQTLLRPQVDDHLQTCLRLRRTLQNRLFSSRYTRAALIFRTLCRKPFLRWLAGLFEHGEKAEEPSQTQEGTSADDSRTAHAAR